ncbi:MAG: hypothetical protein R3B06_15035 [Kofleriaceae bacterium]
MRAPTSMLYLAVAAAGLAAGCSDDPAPLDPKTAPREPIDRFSGAAGTLFVRDVDPTLPAADAPIDYDARFRVDSIGPAGEVVTQYLFDVQARTPAPIYVLFHAGEATPVMGQKNIVSVLPGDLGYSDLWQPIRVDVPADYVANTVTSFQAIVDGGYAQTPMPALVNCPVVPEGSVARVRTAGDYPELTQGWYDDKIIQYFHFGEAPTLAPVDGQVPTSTLYAAFATNPTAGAAPALPFAVDATDRPHNVVAALPSTAGYAPLWAVQVYDNAAIDAVVDLASAQAAPTIAAAAIEVNAPVVAVAVP